jgi:hypothetical protein
MNPIGRIRRLAAVLAGMAAALLTPRWPPPRSAAPSRAPRPIAAWPPARTR